MTWHHSLRAHRAAAWAAALVFALAAGAAPAAPADTPEAAMAVTRRPDGTYEIRGGFEVAAPPERAWEVLTDYANLASFVSSMRTSTVRLAPDGRSIVTQEATGRLGPFSRTLHVILEVRERAGERIEFRDICGRSFSAYAGAWTLTRTASGVRVAYSLDAVPRSMPPLLGASILAANARRLLDDVRIEIARRAGVPRSELVATH